MPMNENETFAPLQVPGRQPRVRISPYARKTAAASGIDLLTLRGTGPNGRIVWRDVQAGAANVGHNSHVRSVSGYYVTAHVEALLCGLEALGDALTFGQFIQRVVASISPEIAVRLSEMGIEGVVPDLKQGECAVLAVGMPVDGAVTLYLAFAPSLLTEDDAAKKLILVKNILENPFLILL